VLLGWALLDEPLGLRKVLGMLAIIAAVLWVRAAVRPASLPLARPVR
jgi:drug/metabolite transporter (DMT)-like permease